jgi:hypothetical protein
MVRVASNKATANSELLKRCRLIPVSRVLRIAKSVIPAAKAVPEEEGIEGKRKSRPEEI